MKMAHQRATRVHLGELATVRAGLPLRKAVAAVADGSHFLLQIRDFGPDRRTIYGEGMVRVSPESIGKGGELREGDIVFLAKGTRNFSCVVRALPGPAVAAPHFFILRVRGQVLPEYLAWFLNQDAPRRQFTRLAGAGARVPVVRREVLENIEVPLPDLATQRRIVEFDALMRRQLALLNELAEKKRTLAALAGMWAATHAKDQENTHE
ncbi:MAG: restriction endonuclease subunit S [Verrucomicrobiae bacterium]|nr:restriction endonuclease subunit S [Verrucomicrobiae bacterium]